MNLNCQLVFEIHNNIIRYDYKTNPSHETRPSKIISLQVHISSAVGNRNKMTINNYKISVRNVTFLNCFCTTKRTVVR